jgi:hypothetical protein
MATEPGMISSMHEAGMADTDINRSFSGWCIGQDVWF